MAQKSRAIQDKDRRIRNQRALVGIYVRVSSESQAEKASPSIQEDDAREYCKQHGYSVVDVYRDIATYRDAKGKLIQPSGTRVDRPQFQRLLNDAREGRINMIVAWREDRLYRGLRPMLEVLDLLDAKKGELRLELVKETFDIAMAPIKAAIARMELSTKNDRWHMGMRGRMSDGKINGYNCYGYDYDKATGKYVKNKEEAKWVYWIWRWYGDGCTIADIHDSLIKNGVPQKVGGLKAKSVWSSAVIRRLLTREYYYTGQKKIVLGEDEFIVPVEPLIDEETYLRWKKRREMWGNHRVTHRTHEYSTSWLDGLVYCSAHPKRKLTIAYIESPSKLVTINEYYRCLHKSVHHEETAGCVGRVPMAWLDRHVWDRIWEFINDPVVFESRLMQRVEQMNKEQENNRRNLDQMSTRIDDLQNERNRVVALYRKGHITEEEVDQQMEMIKLEENELVEQIRKAGNNYEAEIGHIQELVRIYREQVADGIGRLEKEPSNRKLFQSWTKSVRIVLRALVRRVEIDADFNVRIITHIDLNNPINGSGNGEIGSNHSKNRANWGGGSASKSMVIRDHSSS